MTDPPRVMPALVTPFTDAGELDLDAHRHNVHLLSERGLTGFLLGGSTGEGPYLEPGERSAMIDVVRESAPGAFVLSGIAGESTRAALRQVREAPSADALLVLTPTTLARDNDQVVSHHFLDVAEGSARPVFLYSVPRYTGYDLPLEAIVALADHPNIVGIKDSGGDPDKLRATVEETPAEFAVFTGVSRSVRAATQAGAYGAITASGNYAAELVLKLVRSRRAEDQALLTELSSEVERHGIPGVKAAAAAAGLEPGWPRLPLRPLSGATKEAVRTAVYHAANRART